MGDLMNKQLEFQFNQAAKKIVDNNYKDSKNKPAFTQMAENARDLLGYKYNSTTGKFENSDDHQLPITDAVKANDALEKNFQDHKQDDYFKKLKHWGIEESSKKHPDYPKVSNPPILQNNINNKLTPQERRKNLYNKKYGISNQYDVKKENDGVKYVGSRQHLYDEKDKNPTVNRYKKFKEEKNFNKEFEREYGDKAMEKYVRSKVAANKKAGKADYEDLPSSYLIVGEAAKDKARKKLDAIKASQKLTLREPDYISYREAIKDAPRFPTLEQWMQTHAPITEDPPGITGLDKVKNFKRQVHLTNQKFPKVAKGIGPFLTGEDD